MNASAGTYVLHFLRPNDVGVNTGAGVSFGLAGFGAFAEIRFHNIMSDGGSTRFIPITFTPTSSVYANQQCGGVNMIVTNRLNLDSTELGIELAAALHKLYPNDFQLDRIAKLVSNQQTMDDLNAGVDPRFISAKWNEALESYQSVREKYLIYK